MKLWAADVMVAIAVMTFGMQNSHSAQFKSVILLPTLDVVKSYAAVLKYLLYDSDSGFVVAIVHY